MAETPVLRLSGEGVFKDAEKPPAPFSLNRGTPCSSRLPLPSFFSSTSALFWEAGLSRESPWGQKSRSLRHSECLVGSRDPSGLGGREHFRPQAGPPRVTWAGSRAHRSSCILAQHPAGSQAEDRRLPGWAEGVTHQRRLPGRLSGSRSQQQQPGPSSLASSTARPPSPLPIDSAPTPHPSIETPSSLGGPQPYCPPA